MRINVDVDERDVNRVLTWIKTVGADTQKLWNTVIPIMQQQIRREFSDENPNDWRALKPSYLQWKLEQGYPATIGVRKGFLKRAATDRAIIVKGKESLVYSVNNNIAVQAEGNDYFSDFNRKRRIFKHTQKYLNVMYRQAAEKWINNQIEEKGLSR